MKKYIKLIPNILTVIRFIFIPFIVISIVLNNYILALVLFTISSLSDVLDGYIARKYEAITDFGKLMDPLADKLTQISTLFTLYIKRIIPIWIVVIIILKELVLISGASFLYGKKLVVSSKWYGKLATVLLYIAVVSSLLISLYDLPKFDIYIYVLAIGLTIAALLGYIDHFYKKGYLPKKEDLKKNSNKKELEKTSSNKKD